MLLISNMASAIKGIVSKNKIRYKEDGFDLDLSYISKNIIAMGFPAETLERFYRNHIDDVVKFFDSKHKNQYKIYNLCSESKRRYDTSKFHGPVDVKYSFQDHNPPPFSLLKPFCENVHQWLTSDSNKVAAIHCKAGKGRTGVMICAYLVHAGGCKLESGEEVVISDADSALDYYSRHRTHDLKGVTIPSQKRYVYYYEDLVKHSLEYRLVRLRLNSIVLTSVPVYNGGNFTLICEIYQIPKHKIKSYDIEVKRGSKNLLFNLNEDLLLAGDIKFEFYIKKIKKEKLFQFCFNTFFVGQGADASTVSVASCPKCFNGETVSMLSNENMKLKSKSSQDDSSVINHPLLKLNNSSNNRIDNLSRSCDCDLSSNPPDFLINSNSMTAEHFVSKNLNGEPNGNTNNNINSSVNSIFSSLPHSSSESPSSSNLNRENKLSLSSSSTSSSSSTQSLCRKINNSDLQSSVFVKNNFKNLYLVLPKDKLDKAYKDKSNKIFLPDFKVILKFDDIDSGADSEPPSKTIGNHDNYFSNYDNFSSENDTENYSDDEDDSSDLEANIHLNQDQKLCSADNHKKGETTYL